MSYSLDQFKAMCEEYFDIPTTHSHSVNDFKHHLYQVTQFSPHKFGEWVSNPMFPERYVLYRKYQAMARGDMLLSLHATMYDVFQPSYTDIQVFTKAIKDYFTSCTRTNLDTNETYYYKPPTIAGLASFLGGNVKTLEKIIPFDQPMDLSPDAPPIPRILQQAYAHIEAQLVDSYIEGRSNCKLILTTNFKYTDKTSTDLTVTTDNSVYDICSRANARLEAVTYDTTATLLS